MSDAKGEFGVVGLGKMGASLSLQALEKDLRVAGFDITGASQEFVIAGLMLRPAIL